MLLACVLIEVCCTRLGVVLVAHGVIMRARHAFAATKPLCCMLSPLQGSGLAGAWARLDVPSSRYTCSAFDVSIYKLKNVFCTPAMHFKLRAPAFRHNRLAQLTRVHIEMETQLQPWAY